jgi:2-oxoglutarate dehydrogenase E2 component (dihydrolipoamide succinyltransferase)
MSVIDIKVPVIGESISEVTIAVFLKETGDIVKKDESICEIESDKATLEMPAEEGGRIEWLIEEGDDVEIGAIVARIDTSVAGGGNDAPAKPATVKEETPKAEAPAPADKETYATGHPSPAAAKMMAENGLTANDVKGTGKDGRILKEDVEKAIAAKKSAPAPQSKPAPATPKKEAPAPKVERATNFSRGTNRKKMSRMRRTIAKRLLEAKHGTAMLTTFNEVDLTEVMAMRKKYQERFVAKFGIKLGFMSLFAKACAKVLIEMPQVNSILDEKELIYHDYADISIAVSTGDGLVVPVIENAESLTFAEIEYKIKELAGKARNGTLSLEEMTGGTFTITNGGIFGSMMSTPILNPPQSAILGMHNIVDRPMAVNGEIKIRKMMYLALSYDHRVIDGSSAVTFLRKVKELLEDPMTLMLDL